MLANTGYLQKQPRMKLGLQGLFFKDTVTVKQKLGFETMLALTS